MTALVRLLTFAAPLIFCAPVMAADNCAFGPASCITQDDAIPHANITLGTPGTGASPQSSSITLCTATSAACTTLSPSIVGSSVTVTLPNASGTVADGASAPLVLNSSTGNLTCPTCVTSSGGGAITGLSPIVVSAAGAVSLNIGTGLTTSGGTLILANPSASTLGGIESYAAVSHQWINAISASGVPSSTQPAFSDISGALPNSQLASMAAGTVKCNPAGSSAAPQDCWGAASNSVQGTGLIGLDGSQFFIFKNYAALEPSGELSVLRVQKNANYTGGTPGNVYNAIWGLTTVGSGVADFQWSILGVVNNSATGGQNVGVYGQGNAIPSNAGPTWGGTMQVQDQSGSANPTSGRVGLEIDNAANGTDTNGNRVIADLVVQNFNAGSAPTVTYGLRLTNAGGTITNGVYFNGAGFTNFINTTTGTFKVDGSGNLTANSLTLPAWTAYNAGGGML